MSLSLLHGLHPAAPASGTSRQVLASDGQRKLPLIASMQSAPQDAPAALVRSIDSDAQALAVSMQAAGAKCAYVGACIGRSESYVSRLRAGLRPIPDRLIVPLCWATGSNLLAQVRALREALSPTPAARIAALAAQLRDAA